MADTVDPVWLLAPTVEIWRFVASAAVLSTDMDIVYD
jgi:hypothetical protein